VSRTQISEDRETLRHCGASGIVVPRDLIIGWNLSLIDSVVRSVVEGMKSLVLPAKNRLARLARVTADRLAG